MTGTTAHGDVVKSDLTQEELEKIYYFLKRFFLGLLKQLPPKLLKRYILENKAFDPLNYTDALPKDVRVKLKRVAKKNHALIDKYITAKQMLDYSKESIPKLYKVLHTKKGVVWLKRFSALIRQRIKSI
jgi:hypothetical protein